MKFTYNSKEIVKINQKLWLLGMFKIRMINFARPKVIIWNEKKCVLRIKLNRRTKNHLNSMYLGALVIGGDLAAGLPVAYLADSNGIKLSLAFKNLNTEFHKRPNSDVFFEVNDLHIFEELLSDCIMTKERKTIDVPVGAYINYETNDQELVASLNLGLSVKVK